MNQPREPGEEFVFPFLLASRLLNWLLSQLVCEHSHTSRSRVMDHAIKVVGLNIRHQ